MTFDITWFEVDKESRSSEISRDNISKDFVYVVCGRFLEDALEDEYGINDDVLVQQAVYERFAALFYLYRLSDEEEHTLYLSRCSIKQINWETWKITLQYDIPGDNGQQMGGGGAATGPSQDEGPWSEEFTQVSFDTSPTTKTIKRAKLIAQASKSGSALPLLYMVGKQVPIGIGDNEIAGIEVAERSFKFTITQYRKPADLKYSYVRTLSRLTTCTNDATFFGFPRGSVMYLGSSGSGDLYKRVPVDYNFEVKPNFKLSKTGPTVLADPEETDPDLLFDVIMDPDFPSEPVSEESPPFSGWCIIDYVFTESLTEDKKGSVVTPSHRHILQYAEYADFTKFRL